MAERFVRVTRTWDVPVRAEYGDEDQALLEKASAGTIADASESKVLLPADESWRPTDPEITDRVTEA